MYPVARFKRNLLWYGTCLLLKQGDERSMVEAIKLRDMNKQEKIKLAQTSKDELILNILSKDPDDDIRLEVAKNHNSPNGVLLELRKDIRVDVASAALLSCRVKENDEISNISMYAKALVNELDKHQDCVKQFDANLYNVLKYDSSHLQRDQLKDIRFNLEQYPLVLRRCEEYILAMEAGILTGDLLSGANIEAIDLEVANRTGRDVDGVDLPGNTQEEIAKRTISVSKANEYEKCL